MTGYVGGRRSLAGYRTTRQRAEALRSVYFRYLTRIPPSDRGDRTDQLVKAVAAGG